MGTCSCSSKNHLRANPLTETVWAIGQIAGEPWFCSLSPYVIVGKTMKRATMWSLRSTVIMSYEGNHVLPRLPQETSVHDCYCGILFIPLVEHLRCTRIVTCETVSWRAGPMSYVFSDTLLLASSGTSQRLCIVFVEWINDNLVSADNGAIVGKPSKPGALRNFVMSL